MYKTDIQEKKEKQIKTMDQQEHYRRSRGSVPKSSVDTYGLGNNLGSLKTILNFYIKILS